ncbi:anthranilate synthase / indole-3-glycerol phosphate synthase [Basidiobolus ranarum]|uniref:Multifunctional tryptophan biosynthesis protein n=1 Tax=Basidiobolus ranarum TaxID=34480 RepID=A0ABR2WM91_9FUNG
MTTVLIGNYDSFTWNVYQSLREAGANVVMFRNDKTTVEHIASLKPKNLVISPGPGHPSEDVGISKDLIQHFSGKIPILGICLGELCILQIFGGQATLTREIVHGKVSRVKHDGKGFYHGVPQDIAITWYHALAGDPTFVPNELIVTSRTDSGIIMGVRHQKYCIEGILYHPESILSEHGSILIQNFLNCRGGTWEENSESTMIPTTEPTLLVDNNSEKRVQIIFEKIHIQRLADIAEAKATPGRSETQLQRLLELGIAPSQIDFVSRLRQEYRKPAIIAEIKRASPSKGDINVDAIAAEHALIYAEAGASVISVLTESKWFKGSLQDLRQARESVSKLSNRPAILRKDLILDSYQIMEARLEGADTVLLIVAMLEEDEIQNLMKYSRSLGMEPLVEVNNVTEMKKALAFGAKVIGVNNRNLRMFDIDMDNKSRLVEMVPEDVILTALSGITGPQDVSKYMEQGVGAVLISEALMRSPDKKKFIHSLIQSEVTTPNTQQSTPLVKICDVRTVEAVETKQQQGGSSVTFDWNIAQTFLKDSVNSQRDQFPILLASGITSENESQVRPWAVEESNGIETEINPRVQIRDGKIVKYGHNVTLEEARTIKFIKEHTSIPVPEIYDYYTDNGSNYIVMEYIEGTSLENKLTNKELDEVDIDNICLQLREYVNQLRNIKGNYIGTISKTSISDVMFGVIGPYENEKALNAHILEGVAQTLKNYYADFLRSMFISKGESSFYLTHGDLTPRNIIIGENNKIIGIIDWEGSGYLPEYWEYARSRIGVSWNDIWFSKIEKFIDPHHYENMLFNMVMKAYF